jgi:hypothetical protein
MTADEVPGTNPNLGRLIYANRPRSSRKNSCPQPIQKPSWQREMEKAMRATDPSTLLPLVHAAEMALVLRCQELGDSPNTIEEREAIRAATDELLAIKTHRLRWPDFRRHFLTVVE